LNNMSEPSAPLANLYAHSRFSNHER
jgi:hypothetical protein